jgi:hypothetical protein
MSKIQNIPAELNANSFIGDILVAYGHTSRENVDKALAIQQSEAAALTEADKAAGKRSRFTGQILVDEGFATQEQIDFCLEVQKVLRGQQ